LIPKSISIRQPKLPKNTLITVFTKYFKSFKFSSNVNINGINRTRGCIMKHYFTIFALAILWPVFIGAGIINVPGDQPTIQAGIDATANGDTVLVADNTYYENINFNGKAITVASYFIMDDNTGHISNTIIDGSLPSHPDSGSVVTFNSGEDTTSVLCGFTITGGTGTVDATPGRFGGGILCNNSGAKIRNCIIENNTLDYNAGFVFGGGVSAIPPGNLNWVVLDNNTIRFNEISGNLSGGGGVFVIGHTRIRDNIITDNTATASEPPWGGGVYLSTAAGPYLKFNRYVIGNKICNNKALSPTGVLGSGGAGGGLAVASASLECKIMYNEICNNEIQVNTQISAKAYGAGVLLQNQDENTVFAENTIKYNKALNNSICYGAGLAIWNIDQTGNVSILKNIISHNSAGTYGGGLYVGGHVNNAPSIINNTICDNSATNGGAFYVGRIGYNTSHPEIMNSILWNNGSSIQVEAGSVTVSYSDIEGGWTGPGNKNEDPLFADTLCHLAPGSPCIDAGHPDPKYNDEDETPNDMGAYGGVIHNIITGLFAINNESPLPERFQLIQNYPNPFNPTTTIEFSLPTAGFVALKIFNILGEEVATLVSEKLPASKYKYDWDASGLASGVYLYRIEAGAFSQVKKLVLLK
jgi:hypothetical protein